MIASAYDHRRDVQDYIDGVLSGEIVAGRLVRLAVQRHVADLKNAKARGFFFDELAAEAACEFFPSTLVHSIGKWDGEAFDLSPWQKFGVWNVFGWKEIDTKRRRFRKVFESEGRKNGKTTKVAGVALFCQYCDDPPEAGAQLYSVATKEDQAMLVWREAERMARKSPAIRALTTFRHKRLICDHLDSFFKPLGSDSDSTDGLNPHLVLKDEMHAWRERHRGLHEKLSTGGGSREQPLEWIITTAGDDTSEIWIEEYEYAKRVVESAVIIGEHIDDRLFAFIAELDEEDDPFDEDNWPKSNPNLGVSVSLDYLRGQANEAKHKPTAFNAFVRYHGNRRTRGNTSAIKPELWAKGNRQYHAGGWRDDKDDAGRTHCHAGFDLGRSDDFAAVAVCWAVHKPDVLPTYYFKSRTFTCKLSQMVDREPVRSWTRLEQIELHDGSSVDFNEVQRFILDWHKEYIPATWAYDPTFAKQMGQSLFNEHGLQVFEFSQSARFYNEPVREFIKALADGRIIHEGDPAFTWQALNLTIKRNPKDEWMPDKSDPVKKIDAMVAALMAFSECLFAEKQDHKGPWFITS